MWRGTWRLPSTCTVLGLWSLQYPLLSFSLFLLLHLVVVVLLKCLSLLLSRTFSLFLLLQSSLHFGFLSINRSFWSLSVFSCCFRAGVTGAGIFLLLTGAAFSLFLLLHSHFTHFTFIRLHPICIFGLSVFSYCFSRDLSEWDSWIWEERRSSSTVVRNG